MDTLHQMQPHYIRCIKPNQLNQPLNYENEHVLHQLRCGGVLEAIRISCAGMEYELRVLVKLDFRSTRTFETVSPV